MEKKDFFVPLSKGLGATRRAAMLLLVMLLATVAQTTWAENTMYVIAEEIGGTISISQNDENDNSSSFTANKIRLTFYYGERPSGYTEGSTVWSQRTASIGGSCIFDVPTSADTPSWFVSISKVDAARRHEAVVEVLLDPSFAAARPTSTAYWFQYMENLRGLNLNDLNVSKLTNAGSMFYRCTNLKYIYCESNWDRSELTTSLSMFGKCTSLPGYHASQVNKAKAKPQPDGYFTTIGLTYNTAGGYYEINDEQDLIDLGDFVGGCSANHCEGKTFKLTADLDFTNMPTRSVNGNSGNFHPIGLVEDGSFNGCFSGHFDGQNHTIKGLSYTNKFASGTNNNAPVGLFKKVYGSSAVVERVLLIDPQMSGKSSGCGGIAGLIYNGATIRNCTVLGGSIVSNGGKSGGIVGSNSDGGAATIEGCTVIGTSVQDGMIIGYANSQQTIKDCIYYDPDGKGICENHYTDGGGNSQVYQVTLGENVTASGATYSYALLPGKAYYAEGATVSLDHDREGYVFLGYTTTGVTLSGSAKSFTMPASDVTIGTEWADPADISVNAAGTEYTIHTAEGWDEFCDCLDDNDTYNRFSGKTVKLGGDIGTAQNPITRMAGSQYHDFCGTFDGQGYTMTFNYGSAESYGSDNYVAPFSYVSNTKADPNDENDSPAAFRNLHVCGDIYTNGQQAGGIVSREWGTVSITNCRSSVNIHSSHEDEGTHGGLVACVNNGSITIEGCLFDGRLLGSTTTHCAGFVGYNSGTLTITNSLYAPADDETWVSSDGSATFARGNAPTTTNTYYTQTLGDAQGKACHSITAGENVTIDGLGAGTEYSVSGITAYPTGIKYNDVYYAGSGDQVSLTLANTTPAGYQYGYSASAGTLDGTTLTMPDADVTITVGLSVIDWATESDGDADHPYMIYNKDQLDLLAYRVNGTHGETANGYSGKYFKLGNDINYPHSSDWNNFTSDENNFEAIGGNNNNYHFDGHFDGNNKTISGIRIYKGGTGIADNYKGIFGRTAYGADIHDLTLADTRITGNTYIGGIVGYNKNNSTVNRCHVAANVAICAVRANASGHGGIVGVNDEGTIENCISAATLTVVDADNSSEYGGIAGGNRQYSTLHDNLVIGATVPAAADNKYGAITGYNDRSTLQRNYYIACKVADVENATGVGSRNADVTGGAVPGYLLTLGDGVTSSALSITIPEHKELDGSGQLVTVAAVTYNVAAAGTTVWFNSGETEGYSTSYIVDGSPVSGNSITMPAAPVTVTSNNNEHIDLWGIDGGADGSSEHPYIITTTAGWFHLAGNVAAGKSYSDKYFQLGAGISISTMVGTSDHPFSGHFNGNGNTLDIDIISVGEFTAPFRYVSGATITGLHTMGTVTTSHKYATGLVGRHDGDVTISDCRSSVTIVSSVNGDGNHGGFSATGSGTVTIEGCLFDGVICNIANLTNKCGGFVGWRSGTVNISNSLYAPAAVPEGKHAIKSDGSATFARNGADITNSYYTQTLGDAQGKACHSITAGENVTIDGLGAGTEYSVSGITAYPTGIKYNDVYYAGSGDQVSLTLSHGDKAGYAFNEYTATAGTLSGTENPYTLTMPDADVTINTALRSDGQSHDITYIDADGKEKIASAIALDGTETSLAAGWYFVGKDIDYTATVTLGGDVNLILADGETMTVTNTGTGNKDFAIYGDSGALHIYGQSQGTGALTATANSSVAIKVDDYITINGGTVNATSTGDVGIYGIDGVTINGGSVNANGIYADGDITINGGKVTNNSDPGIRSNNGTIILGLSNATDYITAESYNGGVKVADGQTLTDGTNTYSGTLTDDQKTAIAEKTLYLYTEHLNLAANAHDGNYWTTFYCGHSGYKIDEGENAWAYTAEYDAGNARLTLHKLGKVIPMGTAVILVGADNSISMTASSEAAQNTVANDLHGVDIRTATLELGTGTFYVMGKQSGNFGFFPYTAQYMPARKAYLLIDGGAQARGLTMTFDETTSVSEELRVKSEEFAPATEWYTLDGRKVANGQKPTAKGLYIHNGRKIVIK